MIGSPFTNRCRSTDQEGFSLIEAMVAILIFAIGILGAYKLQIHATQGNAFANRVSTATSWAEYAVEELLANDFDSDLLEDDDSDGIAGLELTDNTADGYYHIQPDGSIVSKDSGDPDGNPLYSVYWNIADGTADTTLDEYVVLNDVKQVRVHVVRHGGIGNGLLYSHTYYKAKWPESDE